MARRTLPSDGPYKPGDMVFVWNAEPYASAVNPNKRDNWVRGTVISQEDSRVNVHVDNCVLRANQSKIIRDHDEWHDVAVPGLDNPDPVPLAVEDEDQHEPSIAGGDYAEAYYGEQKHWFCRTGKCDVLVSIFLPSERTYLATTPQLTPEIVEELLGYFMDPVNGSNAKGRKPIGMCCLHVDDLFITGTPDFLEKFKKVVKSQVKIGHEDVNDLMFTGQRVTWVIDEKTRKKSHITVEQSLCVSEITD